MVDIKGKTFGRLTALYPTEKRDRFGIIIWMCQCTCGNTVEVSQYVLHSKGKRSCGCFRKEMKEKTKEYVAPVDGTRPAMIAKKNMRKDNSTGYRGVYRIRDRYHARIGFQGKSYYLGVFRTPELAAEARKTAEVLIHDRFVRDYGTWKAYVAVHPEWKETHPFHFQIQHIKGCEFGIGVEGMPEINKNEE